jgi:hypothetical protein
MRALNASLDVIPNALHYYLRYLLIEHAVFTLDYSVKKEKKIRKVFIYRFVVNMHEIETMGTRSVYFLQQFL